MGPRKKRVNPFYVLLLIAGVAFCLTASAYGVMAVKQLHAPQASAAQLESDAKFVELVDQHGPTAMLVELAILSVATVAAIGTDRFWSGES